jgi:uncharacterized protein DUF4157
MGIREANLQRAAARPRVFLPSRRIQRACTCADRDEANGPAGTLQRAAHGRGVRGEAPPVVGEVLRSSGQPLPRGLAGEMGARMGGFDFSRVRVHAGDNAARSADAVGARAYTVGPQVVFGAGQFRPATAEGRALLAHELAHVVQQSRAPALPSRSPLMIGDPDTAAEREAHAVAHADRQATPRTASAAVVQRDGDGPIDVDLAVPTQKDADDLAKAGIDLPRVSQGVYEQIAGPLDHSGQALTEAERKAIQTALKLSAAPAATPALALPLGAQFLLHDTAGLLGSSAIQKQVDQGRGPLGKGVTAYVPKTGDAIMARPGFFESRRPSTTAFEKGLDVIAQPARETLIRQAWNAATSAEQSAALDAGLAGTGLTADELKTEKDDARAQLRSRSSAQITSTAIWSTGELCAKLTTSGAAAMASKGMEIALSTGCAGLAPYFAVRAQRTVSLIPVEINQETGLKNPKSKDQNTCNPKSSNVKPLPSPAYTASQYAALVKLYLQAALAAGRFPKITTHFVVDAFEKGHCDPRCFDLTRLYHDIAVVMNHAAHSRYGDLPSYGTTWGTHNIWWNDTICGGGPPKQP